MCKQISTGHSSPVTAVESSQVSTGQELEQGACNMLERQADIPDGLRVICIFLLSSGGFDILNDRLSKKTLSQLY